MNGLEALNTILRETDNLAGEEIQLMRDIVGEENTNHLLETLENLKFGIHEKKFPRCHGLQEILLDLDRYLLRTSITSQHEDLRSSLANVMDTLNGEAGDEFCEELEEQLPSHLAD